MSAEVSTVTISVGYRSTTGGILVNYRQNVGRVSFDSRERESTDRTCVLKAPVGRLIGRHITTIDRYVGGPPTIP